MAQQVRDWIDEQQRRMCCITDATDGSQIPRPHKYKHWYFLLASSDSVTDSRHNIWQLPVERQIR